jgi:cytochrome P450
MKPIPRRKLIPIITDLLEYRQAGRQTIAYTKHKIDKYGDVCECSFTGIKNYFIHDPEVIKEMLTMQGPKMKRTYFFQAFRKFLGNGLFTADGELHKQQRKLIKPAFYPERIQYYANTMVCCAEEETSKWKDGDNININQAMTRITLNVISKSLFGSGIGDDEMKNVGEYVSETIHLTNKILQNPFSTLCLINEIKIPIVKKFFNQKEKLDVIVNGIISAYRKENYSEKMDLLSLLMDAKDEETGKGMTDEQIRDEVMTFFLAGHETTSLALTWTWYLIGKHPEVAEKFYAEINALIQDRLPNADDYQKLSYTKNIFKESLRLYPPAWTIARGTKEDIEICGYHFPKNSVLWTVTYLLHHNEKYFKDAEMFIPERWDKEEIKNIPKYAYLPFGGGNRMCIGEGFAWMEGILVLATIAQKYQIQMPNNFITDIDPVFTLRTKQDVIAKVIFRK